jgi:hypothetical protein
MPESREAVMEYSRDNPPEDLNTPEGLRFFYELTGGLSPFQAIEKLIMSQVPDVMPFVYPKVYEGVHQYHSPKLVGIMMAEVLRGMRKPDQFEAAPAAYKLIYPGLNDMIRHRMPMMFVAPELLEAVMATDFKDEVNWRELQLPYEHGIFMLPRGTFRHPKDGDVAFIHYGRYLEKHYPAPLPGWFTITKFANSKSQANFGITCFCPESANLTWYDSNITEEIRPVIRYKNMFFNEETGKGEFFERQRRSRWDFPLELEDRDFLESMGAILFGLLLALEAEPALMGKPALVRKVMAKGDKPPKEFWKPCLIGEHFRIQRIHAKGEGTHASPRWHWRRGHYRSQPYGPASTLRKRIWLKPTMIGGSE